MTRQQAIAHLCYVSFLVPVKIRGESGFAFCVVRFPHVQFWPVTCQGNTIVSGIDRVGLPLRYAPDLLARRNDVSENWIWFTISLFGPNSFSLMLASLFHVPPSTSAPACNGAGVRYHGALPESVRTGRIRVAKWVLQCFERRYRRTPCH